MRQPLHTMELRTPGTDPRSLHSAFGGAYGPAVRISDNKPLGHQGWDLLAAVGTPAYAIARGKIHGVYQHLNGYGCAVVLEFSFRGQTLYAIYGHLSHARVKKNQEVAEGTVVAYTGTSGNAAAGHPPPKPHLHFGIMTSPDLKPGLANFV